MEVDIQDGTGLRATWVGSGRRGSSQIVGEMVRMVRGAVDYDVSLKAFAAQRLRDAGLDSNSDQLAQLKNLFSFVSSNVTYIEDIAGDIDNLKSPRQTLSDGFGDCDDLTILVCALVGSVGFENVCIGLARYDNNANAFTHVYPIIYTNDNQRIVMDASLPDASITDEVDPVELIEVPVFHNTPMMDGVAGLINNIRYHGIHLGRIAKEALPVAANYLPMDFLSSQAMSAASQMLNHSAGGKELSFADTATKINGQLDEYIISLLRAEIALDLAQSLAAQAAAQITLADRGRVRDQDFQTVKQSIGSKLNFIKNFEGYAKENHIPVVTLNGSAMLAVGAVGVTYGAYKLYQAFKRMD